MPMNTTVYLGCDDSGFEMKQAVKGLLDARGIRWVDCGSGEEPSRYPYYAARVASAVAVGKADRGILICGSGIGISIAANKFPGIRAAAVSDAYSARLTHSHNDSNILCLGGRMLGRWQALEIVRVWLDTPYDGGHHQGSLDLLRQMESTMMNGTIWCPEDVPYPPFTWDPDQPL